MPKPDAFIGRMRGPRGPDAPDVYGRHGASLARQRLQRPELEAISLFASLVYVQNRGRTSREALGQNTHTGM